MLLTISLALATFLQGGQQDPRLRPPAPPLSDTVVRGVKLVLERGDTLAAVYPSLWRRGERFVVVTDRQQVVLAAPDPRAERFVPAMDASGRVILPGQLWVAPSHAHPWDTTGMGAVRAAIESLPAVQFGATQFGFDEPAIVDAPGLVRGLLASAQALRRMPTAPRSWYQRRSPTSIHSSCEEAACIKLIEAQRSLFRRALLPMRRADRVALVRNGLALRWLWVANRGSESSGATSPTAVAVEERALENGTSILLGQDSSAYDSLLIRSLTDPVPARWVGAQEPVTEAAVDLRLLDLLGVDWRAAVASGVSADSLLRGAVQFDPAVAIGAAERVLRPLGLGGTNAAMVLPPRSRTASDLEAPRAEYFAAGVQRMVGDTFPLAIDLSLSWLQDSTARLVIEPGRGGAVTIGRAGHMIYPRAARVRLKAPGIDVDLSDTPVLVEFGSSWSAEEFRLVLFLPDRIFGSQDPIAGLGRGAGPLPYRVDTGQGTIVMAQGIQAWRTCCYYRLRP